LFADDTNILNSDQARVSYAIGMTIGHSFQAQSIDVDTDLFLRGVKDARAGGPTLLTQDEMRAVLTEFQKNLAAKRQKIRAELAEKNKAEGEAFLTTNKNNSGVVTLPDGLQYTILTDGSGVIPGTDDTVTVNYRGTLIDGTEFDSSARTGHPAQFRVGGVIHGWTEALTHMKVGSKWRLFIPSELAYGENGRPPKIEPNAVLIFDVELLSDVPPAPLTSDIIKVPSADEMKNGAKIETISPEDVQKLQSQTKTN
jgi:FKBP-type peptidyl-prolyl cis-trans isomerase FklB